MAVAAPEWGHSVHVELDGLSSGRDYWYRFRVGPYSDIRAGAAFLVTTLLLTAL